MKRCVTTYCRSPLSKVDKYYKNENENRIKIKANNESGLILQKATSLEH